jgi:surfeit locus 1 family protein
VPQIIPDLSAGHFQRPLRRPTWLVLLAAVVGCLLTARLGWWQLDRAAQKVASAQVQHARSLLPELPPAALAHTQAEAEAQLQRRIELRGEWRPEATVYLDNRTMDGHTGFLVLTPLQLAPGDAVLVQRGWVPRHRSDRTQLPPVSTPTGTVVVHGRLAPPPSRLMELGQLGLAAEPAATAPEGAIRQNLDLSEFAQESHLKLRPLTVLQLVTASEADRTLARNWPIPTVDVQKHYGYAAQWFALSALIAGLYVWFQIIRPRRQPGV